MEDFAARHYRILFTLLLIAIVILAFYVGILQGKQSMGNSVILSCSDDILSAQALSEPTIPSPATLKNTITPISTSSATGMYAGSKNGTKYYTPGCSGLDRIKPENLIWFKNEEDARLQGYTAASC